ncbi:hypothetical protein KAR91_71970 [Candidatus Pacearchaeota archaeon]|nr:hypothetical protein [Candidatus Pacearchaeota archaeon]
MKIKFLVLFLFLSLPAFAVDFVYSGKLYSGAVANQVTGFGTTGMFEGGIDFGFGIKHDSLKFEGNSQVAFNFISGSSPLDVGCTGELNFRLGYLVNKRVEPFVFSLNEFDSLGGVNWLGYTGGGARIYATDPGKFLLYIDFAMVSQYENLKYTFPRRGKENFFMAYFVGFKTKYRLYSKAAIFATFNLIPIYDFSEVRFRTRIGIELDIIRSSVPFSGRRFGVLHEISIGVDTFSLNKNKYNVTQFTFMSGFKFYF